MSKIGYFGAEGDLRKEETFDQAGNLIHKVQYDENGEIRLDFEYRYDNFGNQIFSKEKNVEEKKMLSWDEWEYDENGNMLKHFEYDGVGDLDYGEQFKYDANGNLTEKKKLGYEGSVYDWYGYEYDEQNREIKEITYNEDGSIYKRIEKEYDEQGNIKSGYEYVEHENGKPILIKKYSSDGLWQEKYEYDEAGRKIKCSTYKEDEMRFLVETIYDKWGDITEINEYTESNGKMELDEMYIYHYENIR